ncbi:MAG: trypsin-like peptidase domain-containing protein, partial [Lachnospiraceae bacterium]|nr:trypsin-like peptidase domain-containing protein [Lachnospiraceae bacterium]
MWEENQEKDLQDNRGEREPLPINGVEAVQEALERKAAEEEAERQRRLVLEEEARHRAEAAAEARRLAEENRRAAEEMNARQKAFYEKFVQHRQEQKNKRIKKMRITAAVLAGLLCLGALTFGLISYRDARTARTELAQIRQELKSVQQTAASAAELARMPGQTSADPASLAVGSAIGSLTDVSNIVEETIRSVVTINTSTKVRISTGFFGEREYTTSGAGSGVIIGDNGTELWIVTNAHVVDDANTISLILADDTEVEAYVKGTSAENDIAVLGV